MKNSKETKKIVEKAEVQLSVLTLTQLIDMITDAMIDLECSIDNLASTVESLSIAPFTKPLHSLSDMTTSPTVTTLDITYKNIKCLAGYINDINEKLAI